MSKPQQQSAVQTGLLIGGGLIAASLVAALAVSASARAAEGGGGSGPTGPTYGVGDAQLTVRGSVLWGGRIDPAQLGSEPAQPTKKPKPKKPKPKKPKKKGGNGGRVMDDVRDGIEVTTDVVGTILGWFKGGGGGKKGSGSDDFDPDDYDFDSSPDDVSYG